jgi:parvulin-like peptidyl-prolyl isomerase
MLAFPRSLLCACAVALAAPACAREAPRPGGDKPILEIDSQVIYLDEFLQYLRDTLEEGNSGAEREEPAEGESTAAADPATSSRLFDQFVEEQLLLIQARKEGVQVPDAEVQAYLEQQRLVENAPEGAAAGEGAADAERFRARVRNTLLAQKFRDQVVLKGVRVGSEEIEKYFRDHPAESEGASRVNLRQIMVDEEPLARRIRAELEQGASFQELAERHSLAPDRGQATQYEEADLPEDLQAVVAGLQVGETSDVIQTGGRFVIFRLEGRQHKSLRGLEDVRERIEIKLLRRKMDEAMARYLADLRSRVNLRLYHENLPFPYQPE